MKHIRLGQNVHIDEFVILGVKPQITTTDLIIGNDAIIRSHSVIYAGTTIGNGFQTGHGVLIREGNQIGDNVSIGSHSVVERDNIIEDDVRIHSNCFIPEFVIIKRRAWLGPSVTILNVLHPPCPKFEECAHSVVIEENAKVGGNVTIGPQVTIGRNALIGAGAVVINNIPPDSVAVGNPAKVIKKIDDMECSLGYYNTPYEWESKEISR